MDKSLSDSDIAPYVRYIVVYSQLKNISARQLLRMIPVAILYQITPNYGHWTLLLKTPEGVTFFDSYGFQPDKEFKFVYQQPHYLALRLLELSKIVPIHYNQYQFQSKKQGISTCGRWICLRSLLDGLTTDQFHKVIVRAAKKYKVKLDQLVVDVIH